MLKKLLKQYIVDNVPQEEVAILFSGGLDSLSILLTLLDLGYKPTLYTFYLEGLISKDLELSRRISQHHNVPLVEVEIKKDIELMVSQSKALIKKYGLTKKTQIQVMHPLSNVFPLIKEDYVFTGIGADTLYGSARKFKKLIHDEQAFYNARVEAIRKPESASYIYIKNAIEEMGKVCVSPYKQSEDIINYFLQLPVSEIRYGKQKKQTYEAFKQEIDELSLYRRNSSMQVNSGIREFHDELLKSEYNTGNYKSVVGIYNTFIREMEQ